MKKYYQIAVDGPAGAGKSTVAKLIAHKLGFLYIDSGVFYRAITLYLLKNKLIYKENKNLKSCIKSLRIDISENQNVFLNKKNITKEIRKLEVSRFVSQISAIGSVRNVVMDKLRKLSGSNNVVMDGRDIGSNILENADLKVYLTASNYIRAKRRLKDIKKYKEKAKLKDLIRQIEDRDNYDSSRKISPLLKAHDAVLIDTSGLTINEVLSQIFYFLPFSMLDN